jgi:hypothetical protein
MRWLAAVALLVVGIGAVAIVLTGDEGTSPVTTPMVPEVRTADAWERYLEAREQAMVPEVRTADAWERYLEAREQAMVPEVRTADAWERYLEAREELGD